MLALALLLLRLLSSGDCQTFADMKNLTDTLFTTYDKTIRPLSNQADQVSISFTFGLVSLLKVDEQQQRVAINAYIKIWWIDEMLRWDPAQYSNINAMYQPLSNVWYPSIAIFNALADTVDIIDPVQFVYITRYGSVNLNQPCTLEMVCPLDSTKFPYDKHTCKFIFNTPPYLSVDVCLTGVNKTSKPVASGGFISNGEWEVPSISTEYVLESLFNICQAHISVTFQRQPGFFVLNLLFPTCTLSLLNIFVFILPADSGEKVGFSITVLLSVMLFLSSTTQQLPPTSEVVPLITQYMTILTIISILSVVATVIILFVHYTEEKQNRKQSLITAVIRKMRSKLSTSTSANTKINDEPLRMSVETKYPRLGSNLAHKQEIESKTTDNSCPQMASKDMSFVLKDAHCQKSTEYSFVHDDRQLEHCLHDNSSSSEGNNINLIYRFRNKIADFPSANKDDVHEEASNESKTQSGRSSDEKGIYFFKQLGRNLDYIFFVAFLFVWIISTMYYMISLFA